MNPPAATQGAEYRRSRTNLLAALILVAGMYIYFLLFAQLGFLQGIRASGLGPAAVKVVLAAMAAAGIAASLSAPRVIFGFGRGGAMSLGLLLCASAAASAGFAFVSGVDGIGHLLIAAVGMGTGLGWATVGLAADLRRLTAGRDTGLCVGGGMAIAYFVSIIPAVYHAPPTTKAWIGAIVAATVIVLVGVSRGPQGGREAPDAGLVPPRWRSGRGLALAAAAFFALVWFDSVASAARQLAPGAYAREWGDDLARWTTGSVHAVAAIIVGGWLDRGHIRAVLGAAFAMLSPARSALTRQDSARVRGAGLRRRRVVLFDRARGIRRSRSRGGGPQLRRLARGLALRDRRVDRLGHRRRTRRTIRASSHLGGARGGAHHGDVLAGRKAVGLMAQEHRHFLQTPSCALITGGVARWLGATRGEIIPYARSQGRIRPGARGFRRCGTAAFARRSVAAHP